MKVTVAGPIDLRLLEPLLETPVTNPGYSFPMTAHLVLAFAQMGVEVSVVATDPAATAPYRLSGPRLDVRVVPMRPRARDRARDFFRAERRGIRAALEELAPDVVHAHWTYEFALAAESSRGPALVTVHDWAPAVLTHHRDAYRAVRLAMQVRALASARHLSAVSPMIQGKVERYYRKTVTLIPNGIPESYFQPPTDRQGDTLVFGALVNGDDPLKNLRILVEAFSLRADHDGESLVLAGRGCSIGEPLNVWARERGLDRGVTFRGPMPPDEVPGYLAGLDAFVHPALEESFGMVILEAMAAGVPVIAGARSGAVPWVLDEGRAGILSDVRSPRALAAAMGAMVDRETRARCSEQGQTRASSFRMEHVAAQYVEKFRDLLG